MPVCVRDFAQSLCLKYGLVTAASSSLWREVMITFIFTALLCVHDTLLSLPFSLYRTFVVEQKHGFNKTVSKRERKKGSMLRPSTDWFMSAWVTPFICNVILCFVTCNSFFYCVFTRYLCILFYFVYVDPISLLQGQNHGSLITVRAGHSHIGSKWVKAGVSHNDLWCTWYVQFTNCDLLSLLYFVLTLILVRTSTTLLFSGPSHHSDLADPSWRAALLHLCVVFPYAGLGR